MENKQTAFEILQSKLTIEDTSEFRLKHIPEILDAMEEYVTSSQTEISDEIFGQELFNYFSNQHNISLLQSEMHDIIDIVKKMEQTEISDTEVEFAGTNAWVEYNFNVSDDAESFYAGWKLAIKWYREQLKIRQ